MQSWVDVHVTPVNRYSVYGAVLSISNIIVLAGHACRALQGLLDLVIASVGFSIGMDTAEREDHAQILTTNTLGAAAAFHPFAASVATRVTGMLVGIGSVSLHTWSAWPQRLLRQRRTSPTNAKPCVANCGTQERRR